MTRPYSTKIQELKELFAHCKDVEDRYERIISLGKEAPPFPQEKKRDENRVEGCQSSTYIISEYDGMVVTFAASSDALISAGLAALLIKVYSGEAPEVILKNPPNFLDDLGIAASLTPTRVNGLYSMHLRMKQDALKHLMNSQNNIPKHGD